ncbi:MAG: ATP-binding protein, partial [Deltaproteobacteria bacterium]|nr:ATP-binding protein [Deltaproteobacteria bacterium]
GVPLLGEIPIDPEMVALGDRGELDQLAENENLEINRAYDRILEKLL